MSKRIVIVGGGINGAGIARDAAMRGLDVQLFEKGDFCSGTSWTSSKLIHGGLRYLEHFEFGLVRESLRERETLLRIHPHNVTPLPFLIPMYTHTPHAVQTIRAGLTLYDLFSYDKSLPNHRFLSREEILEFEPGLDPDELTAGFFYTDCQCRYPERLVISNLHSAVAHGARVFNYHEVVQLVRQGDHVEKVVVRDVLTGETIDHRCDYVVNAAGPWVDRVLDQATDRLIGGTKGTHIVVKLFPGAPRHAVYVNARSDGRPLFILPWRGYYLVGTTDTRYDSDPDFVRPAPNEIEYLLKETNVHFPNAQLGLESIVFCMSGVRPLPFVHWGHEGGITRRHILVDHAARDGIRNMVSLVGGKLTTFRHTAEDIVDFVARRLEIQIGPCSTAGVPLWGSDSPAVVPLGTSPGISRHLVQLYGDKVDQVLACGSGERLLSKRGDDVEAQVVYAVRTEWARRLADVMWRRTTAGMNQEQGLDCVECVARVMGDEMGWDEKQRMEEIRRYEEYVTAFVRLL